MTPEIIEKARDNAAKGGYDQVEFRLGEIEHLPVSDHTVDVVIANCVINLSPDKPEVFKEVFRVLKPGGRLVVLDVVLNQPLPKAIRQSVEAYVGCLPGAILKEEYLSEMEKAGFGDVGITDEAAFLVKLMANDPAASALVEVLGIDAEDIQELGSAVISAKMMGKKPG